MDGLSASARQEFDVVVLLSFLLLVNSVVLQSSVGSLPAAPRPLLETRRPDTSLFSNYIIASDGDNTATSQPEALSLPVAPSPATPSAVRHFSPSQCRQLADLSANSHPIYSDRPNGGWECTYAIEFTETGHTPSIFVQVRGNQAGIWSNFRLKLNFGSPLSRQALGQRASNLVTSLVGREALLPMDLSSVLASGRDFEVSFEGVNLEYKRERLDQTRFNLNGRNLASPATDVLEDN